MSAAILRGPPRVPQCMHQCELCNFFRSWKRGFGNTPSVHRTPRRSSAAYQHLTPLSDIRPSTSEDGESHGLVRSKQQKHWRELRES